MCQCACEHACAGPGAAHVCASVRVCLLWHCWPQQAWKATTGPGALTHLSQSASPRCGTRAQTLHASSAGAWASSSGRRGWEARGQGDGGPATAPAPVSTGRGRVLRAQPWVWTAGWGCLVANPRAGPGRPPACVGWWPRSPRAGGSACARSAAVPAVSK